MGSITLMRVRNVMGPVPARGARKRISFRNGFGSASIWFPSQNTFTCIIPLGTNSEGKRVFGSGGNLGGANSSKSNIYSLFIYLGRSFFY